MKLAIMAVSAGIVVGTLILTGCSHPVSQQEYEELLQRVQQLEDTVRVHRDSSGAWASETGLWLRCTNAFVRDAQHPRPAECGPGDEDPPPPAKPGW
jgi:outer membrane murein-binding lipoprotein Lpp